MDFSQALVELKNGKKITRAAWKERGWWVVIQLSDNFEVVPGMHEEQAYLRMKHTNGFVPWAPQQFDLFATDYLIISE